MLLICFAGFFMKDFFHFYAIRFHQILETMNFYILKSKDQITIKTENYFVRYVSVQIFEQSVMLQQTNFCLS